MPVSAGTRTAGGMGELCRAKDMRLNNVDKATALGL